MREIQFQEIRESDFIQNNPKVAGVEVGLFERKRVYFFFDLDNKHLRIVGRFRRGNVIPVMEAVRKLNHGHKEYKGFDLLLRSCDKQIRVNQNHRIIVLHYLSQDAHPVEIFFYFVIFAKRTIFLPALCALNRFGNFYSVGYRTHVSQVEFLGYFMLTFFLGALRITRPVMLFTMFWMFCFWRYL